MGSAKVTSNITNSIFFFSVIVQHMFKLLKEDDGLI